MKYFLFLFLLLQAAPSQDARQVLRDFAEVHAATYDLGMDAAKQNWCAELHKGGKDWKNCVVETDGNAEQASRAAVKGVIKKFEAQ